MGNNEIYNYLCKKFENLNEEDKKSLLVYKSALSYHINEISTISNIENKNAIQIFNELNNSNEFEQKFLDYKNILEQPENTFIKYSIFNCVSFDDILLFIESIRKIYFRIISISNKTLLPDKCKLYGGFSYDKNMSFLSKGNIISTSLNLDNVEDFLFYDLNNVLYELNVDKNVNALVIPYSIKRVQIGDKIILKLNKEDSQQEIILFKSKLFFDLKNVKNFENDNLKVEKYNVFLKNEKNNQYNVKK